MKHLRPALCKLPGFVNFVFGHTTQLYRLFAVMGAVAGAILVIQAHINLNDPGQIVTTLLYGVTVGAMMGVIDGLLLAYCLLHTYRFWVYLHYRARPRVKGWFTLQFIPAWGVASQIAIRIAMDICRALAFVSMVAVGVVISAVLLMTLGIAVTSLLR